MNWEENKDKTNFSRVDAYLPLTYRLVHECGPAVIQSEVIDPLHIHTDTAFLGIEDQSLSESLKILNDKLDKILDLLTVHNQEFHSPAARFVNISGAGLRFTTSEKFKDGDILEVRISLTVPRYKILRLYGRIICIEERPEGYLISLSFIHIDDSVTDEIVRFVFEREREILREKRGDIT